MHRLFWLGLMLVAGCAAPLPDDLACREMDVASAQAAEISQAGELRAMTPEEEQIFGMGAMFSERAEAMPRAPRAARPPIDVALLSAGGQWGAFTAGFMNGWSLNRTEPRPEAFDVVTGVSTGALLAPFVFGGSAYDADLKAVYDGLGESDVLRRRSTLELAVSASLWDPAPLERQVDEYLGGDIIDVVASADPERTLLVGTVNLGTGYFEAFDLTALARSDNADKPACFREALMASAAIPVAFPPRRINGALYVDGGARQGLFLRGLAEAPVRPRIYVFLNDAVSFPEEDPSYSLPGLAGRSSEILSDELLRSSAADAIRVARDEGWQVRGVFAPDIWPGPECASSDGSKLNFCESFTRALYQAGFETARDGPIPWLDADTLLDRLALQSATARRTN